MDGRGLGEVGSELIAAARALGPGAMATALRAWVVPELFHAQESYFAASEDPMPPMIATVELCAERLRAMKPAVEGAASWRLEPIEAQVPMAVEDVTARHYGNLFAGFSPVTYWDEPTALLATRLERNHIATDFAGKTVLDAGCGGGRYSVAWRKLGAARVIGVDLSPINIATAEARAQEAGIGDVEYRHGNVLALPVADASCGVVFSNGVLHHTRDWRVGVRELLRVLEPGGFGWLYLIESPGGMFWDMIDIAREVMRGDSHDVARAALQLLQLPQNRVFYLLDHVMVPINERLTPTEIETELAATGAREIRRLTRGADFDRIEQIARDVPYATLKFGVGENRYVFTR